MPFDFVALACRESYIDSLLLDESTAKKLKEQQFLQKVEEGNYRDMEIDKLERMFGGGK